MADPADTFSLDLLLQELLELDLLPLDIDDTIQVIKETEKPWTMVSPKSLEGKILYFRVKSQVFTGFMVLLRIPTGQIRIITLSGENHIYETTASDMRLAAHLSDLFTF